MNSAKKKEKEGIDVSGVTKSDVELLKRIGDRIAQFERIAAFPTQHNHILESTTIKNLTQTTLDNFKSVYPLCHGAVLLFGHKFIQFKREYGSPTEKKLYNDKFTVIDLFDRIATKRAIYFLNPGDSFMLRNGVGGMFLFIVYCLRVLATGNINHATCCYYLILFWLVTLCQWV